MEAVRAYVAKVGQSDAGVLISGATGTGKELAAEAIHRASARQQILASMVMMGMQRIVIESGRINAAMRFHIDTRDAASADSASRFNLENRAEVSGKFGFGPWGAFSRPITCLLTAWREGVR